jgi:hypothetical protein
MTGINLLNLIISLFTVFCTVVLVVLVKVFGNINCNISSIGTDFNLLTYGFLWDTSATALRGQEYWPRFPSDPSYSQFKPIVLLAIFIANFLFMALNLKLVDIIQARTQNPAIPARSRVVTKWLLSPSAISLGFVSLVFYIYINSIWN